MEEKHAWRFGVAGNIVAQHIDENGILRFGTPAFTGGTKVYIDGKHFGYDPKGVSVIGLNRFHEYQIVTVPPELIENVRTVTIHKPSVLKILERVAAMDGWEWWGRIAKDRKECKKFVDNWPQATASYTQRDAL